MSTRTKTKPMTRPAETAAVGTAAAPRPVARPRAPVDDFYDFLPGIDARLASAFAKAEELKKRLG